MDFQGFPEIMFFHYRIRSPDDPLHFAPGRRHDARGARESRGGDGIGHQGRRRRPRVWQHVRNDVGTIHINYYGDWRSPQPATGLRKKNTATGYRKKTNLYSFVFF